MSSKPILYLHIGTSKTGTTTVQQFLRHNSNRLKLRGILYPRTSKRAGHHNLASFFSYTHFPGFKPTDNVDGLEIINEIKREFKTLDKPKALILSSEAFEGVKKSIGDLLGHFGEFEIKLIIFLRRQDMRIEARYRQHAKFRRDIPDVKAFFDGMRAAMDYPALLSRWEKFIPRENISVTPYRPDQWTRPLEEVFCRKIGISGIIYESLERKASANVSLNAEAIRYLQETHSSLDLFSRQAEALREKLAAYSKYATQKSKDSWFYSPQLRKDILKKYHDSNSLLSTRYLGGRHLWNETVEMDRDSINLNTPQPGEVFEEIYDFIYFTAAQSTEDQELQ